MGRHSQGGQEQDEQTEKTPPTRPEPWIDKTQYEEVRGEGAQKNA